MKSRTNARFLPGCVRASDGGDAGDHGAAPDDGFEAELAVNPPEKCRHLPEAVGPELTGDLGEEFGHGLDSLRADEPSHLAAERDEGNEVDERDGAGEERRSDGVRWRVRPSSPRARA